jgi:hypothetical protein
MKYLVVGWNSKYMDPGFRTEHDTLEAAIAEAAKELSNNSHQVSVEIFASQKLLVGTKSTRQLNGVLSTPERFDEARAELNAEFPEISYPNPVAALRERRAEIKAGLLKSRTE